MLMFPAHVQTRERKRRDSKRWIFSPRFMKSFVSVLSAAVTSDTWYGLSACSHISQRVSVTAEGLSKAKSRTSMSTRGAEARSPACEILKGVRTHTHTHTHIHRAILFNLSSHPCQDYVRWDKIDHFWYILMNNSIFYIFPAFGWVHPWFFLWRADQLMALYHSCCF